jgi:WD40 repeat protein
MTCPDRDLMTRYVLGQLDDAQAERISDHLGECPRCRAVELEVENARDDLLELLRRPVPEAGFLSEPTWRALKPRLGRLGEDAGSGILSTVGDAGASRPSLTVRGSIGRYQIQAELGRGGMGVVYRAFDPKLDRTVAIKLPFFDAGRPEHAVVKERFLREMQAAARVEHANVCPVYDTGEIDGAPYAVMKFLDGGSLSDRLRKGAMTVREAVEMARKIALGLREIHRVGVIHRDLKPGNVLLTREGEPAVSDFGLARQDTDAHRLTPDGAGVGTPAYVAPEQAEGHDRGRPTMDVYSLGVILFEMLTGRLPFTGSILEILKQASADERPRASLLRPEIDAALEAIVLKATSRRPEQRYQTAKELIADLDGWLAGEAVPRVEPPQPEAAAATAAWTEPKPRNRSILIALGAGGVLLALVAVAAVWGVVAALRPAGGGVGKEVENKVAGLPSGGEKEDKDKGRPPDERDDRGKTDTKDKDGGKQEEKDQGKPKVKEVPLPPAALVMRPAKIEGVRRWTIEPRRPVKVGNHHSIAWSPDGRKVAAGAWSDHGFCTVRSANSGAVEVRIDKVKFPFGSQPWCRTGIKQMLALVKTADGSFALYDGGGTFSRTLKGLKGRVLCFAVSKHGDYVAAGDDTGTFQVFHITMTDRKIPPLSLGRGVDVIAWGVTTEDYHSLATQQDDGQVRLYHSIFQKPEGKPYPAGRLIAWSPLAAQLATQQKETIVLLHPSTGEEQLKLVGHKGQVTSVSWRTEKGQLASVDDKGSLRRWNLQTGKEVSAHSLPHADGPWLFAPFGQTLACCVNNAVYFASGRDGSPLGVSMLLADDKYVAISAEGHYAGSPGVDAELVYKVDTEDGKKLELTPDVFAKKYGWSNDPKKVKLLER